MKKLLLSLIAMFTVIAVSAQLRTVSGTVVSADDGEPLAGASVQPAGGGNGVATDLDGHFTIQVPQSVQKLQVSYVGMVQKIVAITGKPLSVALEAADNSLNEVMVVAYGTTKKSEYTGSAGVVKAEELEDVLVSSATNALSGKIAGVQTLSSNGQPGESASVRIRGVGSINVSSSPLYVVDGLPFDGDIATISTNDIESMTVIKDAASTALYGARGANGVILITTKSGREGNAKVTVDMRWGANTRALSNYDVITDPRQYIETLYQANRTYGARNLGLSGAALHDYSVGSIWSQIGYQTYTVPEGQTIVGSNGKFNPYATAGYSDGRYTYLADDWTKGTISDGLRQEYNVSISGGTDRVSYYVSGNYLNDEGIITNSHFNRFSTRATVDFQAKKWLKIGTNIAYTYTNSGYPDDQTSAGSSSNAFYLVNTIAPVYPLYIRDAQGNIMRNATNNQPIYDYGEGGDYGNGYAPVRPYMAFSNPASKLIYDTTDYLVDVFNGKWYATLTPVSGLTITGTAGYLIHSERLHYLANNLYGQSASYNGEAEQASTRLRTINLQAIANYTRQFGDHNVSLMVGFENQSTQSESVTAYGQNLYNPSAYVVNNTIDNRRGYGAVSSTVHRGFIANAKYNYLGRYYFTAAYRRDGSSRFAPEHRWGNFWSVSAAWDIAKESFMQESRGVVDLLKLKASFGQNGNDAIGSNGIAYLDQYTITGADGVWSDGTLYYKGNRNITWETSNSLNVGVDFSFWRDKLSGSIEYYQRQTSNMLFYLPVSPSLGYSSIPSNVGSMRNNGFEFDLNYTILHNRNLKWAVNANLTLGKNKVLKLDPSILNANTSWQDDSKQGWLSGSRMYVEGESMYNLWIVEYAGVEESTGRPLYYTWVDATDEDGNRIPYSYEEDGETVKQYVQTRGTTTSYSEAYNNGRISTGNLLPKGYGGFGTTFEAYGFDFSATFAYQFGGRIFDSGYQTITASGANTEVGLTWSKDVLNAWTPENHTNYPALCLDDSGNAYNSTSTRYLISSNYLSLNNITLGYTLPTRVTRKAFIDGVRVYFAAENVALWSRRKGLDPRQGYVSSDNTSTYSPIRAITGGIKVTF
jgi:TonB-linked SusC/RagA family outer membrane protein